MAKLGKPIVSESVIMRGLILDSRDLFSKERYEERIDKKLAEHMQKFKKNKTVNLEELRKDVEEFIAFVEKKLKELEDAKKLAVQEEYLKLDRIRKLYVKSGKINSKKLKKELEKFGESLKSNTLSVLRYNRRREKLLRRERTPFGFVSKKLRQDRYLDADVSRKAFKIGKHNLKEPKMFSEIDYLTSMLNKNPNEETLNQLKERIHRLTKNYEGDIDDFLTIEVDIGIEEARRLHRIDHYITFLKMIRNVNKKFADELIKKLTKLKSHAGYWIYQDTVNAKQLQRYATKSLNYGEKVLKSSEALEDEDFPDIEVRPLHLIGQRIPGLLIIKKSNINNFGRFIPNRGIILVHGVFSAKESLSVLGKRLASLDFVVLSIDTASHGESRAKFKLGTICENIQNAVSWLRSQGVRKVGVIGHSLGTVCAIFAIGGYNNKVEDRFYKTTTKLIEEIKNIKKPLDKIAEYSSKGSSERDYADQYNRAVYHSTLLIKQYAELKQIILDGLKEMYQSNSRIDCAVLLSAPKTCQMFFPPKIAWAIKHLPKVLGRKGTRLFAQGLTKGYFWKYKKQEGKNTMLPDYSSKKGRAQILGGTIENIHESFDYAQTVKNPYDFLKDINYFCDNVKNPDKTTNFIRYYRDFIRRTPKLYIYGLADKPMIKGLYKTLIPITEANKLELEKHYANFGATDIVRVPDVDHYLNTDIKSVAFQAGRLPRITYKIVTFLNNYLGKGRLI